MCKFERNLNRIYVVSGIILLLMVLMCATSCTTSSFVTSCPAYSNIEPHQTIQAIYNSQVDCENCDEID